MDSRKIIVRISGGLGNQIFQIAAALLASQKSGISSIFLDDRFLSNYETKRDLDSDFIYKHFKNMKIGYVNNIFISNASRLRVARILDKKIKSSAFISSSEVLLNMDGSQLKNILLDGYFQDPLVACALKSDGEFFRKMAGLYGHIKNSLPLGYDKYVGIHIRRGDYVTSKSASKVFRAISLDYYREAIKKFPLDTKFIIFADDAEIRSNFSREIGALDVGLLNLKLSEEFMLLANADHYVIANSTFSWWAAYIGYDESKRVISPHIWYSDEQRSLKNPLLMQYFEMLE
jgi:hypothetical protein